MTRNTSHFWQAKFKPWDADNPLICSGIVDETHDVKSFFFKPKTPAQFQFIPGQFITLALPINGEMINRSYTVSSSPARPHTISITVKRQPNGIVSNWLHDHLKIGDQIDVLPIAGDFSCALSASSHIADKFLFLSGGSGITPLMSMSRSFHDLAENTDIVFVHSARTPADIIFRQELDLIAFNMPNFRPVFICERINKESSWAWPVGYLTLDYLKQIAPDFLQREIFTCGPSAYMAAVRAMLISAGFNMQHYHQESFSFEVLPSNIKTEIEYKEVQNSHKAATFSVAFTKSGVNVDCAPDQFVLDAGLAAGLRLASSCRQGLCGTCKTKLIAGKVDMKHGGGIRQREIDQGLFLPCCSKPLSDLIIER